MSKQFPHSASGRYLFDGVPVDVTFDYNHSSDDLCIYEVFVGGYDVAPWMSESELDRLAAAMARQDAASNEDARIDAYIDRQEA